MAWDAAARYRFLLDINNAIIKETTRSGLFKALADEISKIFKYDRFSINLYNPENQSLSYFATAEGISPEGISKEERPLEKGAIANAVIRSREPLIIPDLSTHTYWESARSMLAAGLKATMAYPLVIRNEVLGTIHFSFTSTPPNILELVEFLTELSAQAAIAVANMLAHTELKMRNENLELQKDFLLTEKDDAPGSGEFFFASKTMSEIIRQVDLIADSDVSILITGETGTGKDHIARRIHNASLRRDALFVKVNCPALTTSLFESELFGHSKGAFTGAHEKRIGRFEMADGGTIFLDEIGELESSLQAKLLHVLQDMMFERVGDSRTIRVNYRLISATNKDLKSSISNKSFRSDLYYRLNTVSIHVPPLRERLDDIPMLVKQLTLLQSQRTHRPAPQYSESSLEALRRYHWPGNVRELKNLVKRIVIMRPGEIITGPDVDAMIGTFMPMEERENLTLAEAERRHIEKILARTGGMVGGSRGAAALLGIPRSTLQYRMKKHGINPAVFAVNNFHRPI